MSDEAKRFRKRAKECRELAEKARDPVIRRTLADIADDLEAEAAVMDGEDAADA